MRLFMLELHVRERAFLRALLHEDYIRHLSHISALQIKFITDNPSSELFITLSTYRESALRIEIHSAIHSPLSATLRDRGPEWVRRTLPA
ncbi:hypothetical protein B0H13DRAFT_2318857 [Mycena leptocephala]|nr:hypothetical protein B0H13DRAFT_2318857 [Mycena leptocephala]